MPHHGRFLLQKRTGMCFSTGRNSHGRIVNLITSRRDSRRNWTVFVARERVAMKHLWNQSLKGQQRQDGTKIDPYSQARCLRVELHPSRFKVNFKSVSRSGMTALCNDSQFNARYFSAKDPEGRLEASP